MKLRKLLGTLCVGNEAKHEIADSSTILANELWPNYEKKLSTTFLELNLLNKDIVDIYRVFEQNWKKSHVFSLGSYWRNNFVENWTPCSTIETIEK